MTQLPIKPVVLPADLKNQKNGQLDPKLLVDIPGGKAHHLAAKAWLAMVAEAKKAGLELKPTSPADAYRTLAIQEKTFLKRYDNTKRDTRHEKYQGKDWWLKPKVAGAAVPGTSNHGWGLAVDVASMNSAKLTWLLANVDKFGFSWEAQSENWHIRYVAGDKIPAAVK
jgi:LAS superfamily LD-carboxypeptidase LdcB